MTPLLTPHPDAFPTSPPPDLDDPRVIAERDWAAFGAVSEMRDHWQRPGSSANTRAYYWLLEIADPLTGSHGALRYSVAPWTPIVDLHQRLVAASVASGLPAMKPSSRLRPHIGIGYCNRPTPTGPMRAAVESLRLLASLQLRVDRVQLAELRREAAAYTWRVIHAIHLPTTGVGR
ncbi:2'-5' RNA ligase family protein [Streptomyces sp. MBT62]|uniref:2'-5' RNA ligase family protein n=1 Tax=Streptomyces sp. MBT62 TaxID=2800410 RepID=UPI00190AC143|nr:2'-5' RNA ligase family protein [Streptomyces sp. MBT62]MBK3564144.1 hypothetical protein [Streptomyces sp. MBT62]